MLIGVNRWKIHLISIQNYWKEEGKFATTWHRERTSVFSREEGRGSAQLETCKYKQGVSRASFNEWSNLNL